MNPLPPLRWLPCLALAACGGDDATDGPKPACDPSSRIQVYHDDDNDGFGLRSAGLACDISPGLVAGFGDCDDTDPLVNPSSPEICDGVDNDCSFEIDDGLEDATYYRDADGDGFGDPADTATGCGPPAGYVDDASDCDDIDPLINPSAEDICNGGVDDNCDGDSEAPDTYDQNWYFDGDSDGAGAGASLGSFCLAPSADAAPGSAGIDCDDNNPFRFPANPEICGDGIDQDCSGTDLACGPIGSYLVDSGPTWSLDPPVYSCIEACAVVFGGVATDYHCSTTETFLDYQAFLSGFGDDTYCTTPRPEDYKVESLANPGYDCGGPNGCSYSAYVQDHCTYPLTSTNWCWLR